MHTVSGLLLPDEWPAPDELAALDAYGVQEVVAINHVRSSTDDPGSATTPHLFTFEDGNGYWVKRTGTTSELIGGRLAAAASSGPASVVTRVDASACPENGSANHLMGLGVGSLDVPRTVNSKRLHAVVAPTAFSPDMIDMASYAQAEVFYAWTAMADPQVLINVQVGTVSTIDYGGGLTNLTNAPLVKVTIQLPGFTVTISPTIADYERAVAAIEAISAETILECVARVPNDPAWNPEPTWRCALARALVERQSRLRSVFLP